MQIDLNTFLKIESISISNPWRTDIRYLPSTLLEKIGNETNCWDDLSISHRMSEDFIEKHKDHLNWSYLAMCHNYLSEDFIEKYENRICFKDLGWYGRELSENFLKKHKKKLDWEYITLGNHITEEFIENNLDVIDLKDLLHKRNFSDKFINKHKNKYPCLIMFNTENPSEDDWRCKSRRKLDVQFADKYKEYLDWNVIFSSNLYSENFIERYIDKIDWYLLSQNQNLSEKFIEKYQDKVDWYCISQCQELSLEFIAKYKDKVMWGDICTGQHLPLWFIIKYQDKINWDSASIHQKVPERLIEKYANEDVWKQVSRYQTMSYEFIKKHITELDMIGLSYNPHIFHYDIKFVNDTQNDVCQYTLKYLHKDILTILIPYLVPELPCYCD